MIRKATLSDVGSICDMSEKFWDKTMYDEEFDRQGVADMATLCIDQHLACVLVIDNNVCGFACGLKGALLGNNSVSQGTEVAWWVDPEHRSGRNGISLMKHIEALAKEAGIKYWNMVYMESSMPDEIKKIYERLGYVRNEVTYTRVL